MSYDLDQLHQKYGLNFASVRFATQSDMVGVTLIPAVAGAEAVVHQIAFAASAWAQVQLDRATGAASAYWTGFAGQTQLVEGVRIVGDASAAIFADLASVSAVTGSGFLHVWYCYQRATNSGGASIGNL